MITFLDVFIYPTDIQLLDIALIYVELKKFFTASLDYFSENYVSKVKVIIFIRIIAIQLLTNSGIPIVDIFAHFLLRCVSSIKRLCFCSDLQKKTFSRLVNLFDKQSLLIFSRVEEFGLLVKLSIKRLEK